MTRPSELTIVMDGWTIQQAGELILDWSATSDHRLHCRATYARCTEDFVFAVLFGAKVVMPKSFANVGDGSPGESLAGHFKDIAERSSVAPSQEELLELLESDIFRPRIETDLKCFHNAVKKDATYWKDYMLREVPIYFGNQKCADGFESLEEIEFKRRPRLLVSRSLQNEIPQEAIGTLLDHIHSGIGEGKIPFDFVNTCMPSDEKMRDIILREFVSRCVLTSVALAWWYDSAAQDPNSLRLPHIIRAQGRQSRFEYDVGSEHHNSPAQESSNTCRNAIDLLIRHGLSDVLPRVRARPDFVKWLGWLREVKPYPSIRRLLAELVMTSPGHAANEKKRDKENMKIIQEIAKISSPTAYRVDRVRYAIETMFYPRLRSWRWALRQLHPTAYKHEEELTRVFPELHANYEPSKIVHPSIFTGPVGVVVNKPNAGDVTIIQSWETASNNEGNAGRAPVMASKSTFSGPVGVVVIDSEVRGLTVNQIWNTFFKDSELEVLVDELRRLQAAIRTEPSAPEKDSALAAVVQAEIAAQKGDGPAVLRSLSKAGRWTLSCAEKIGTEVAAAMLKKALGL